MLMGWWVRAEKFARPVRWLVSRLVWTDWCWFIVREKHCWLVETNKRTGCMTTVDSGHPRINIRFLFNGSNHCTVAAGLCSFGLV